MNDETNSETTKWNTIELELFQRILTKKKHSTRFNRDSSRKKNLNEPNESAGVIGHKYSPFCVSCQCFQILI